MLWKRNPTYTIWSILPMDKMLTLIKLTGSTFIPLHFQLEIRVAIRQPLFPLSKPGLVSFLLFTSALANIDIYFTRTTFYASYTCINIIVQSQDQSRDVCVQPHLHTNSAAALAFPCLRPRFWGEISIEIANKNSRKIVPKARKSKEGNPTNFVCIIILLHSTISSVLSNVFSILQNDLIKKVEQPFWL